MATKLFLRKTTQGAPSNELGAHDMLTTAGASVTTSVTNTQASGTEVWCTETTAGGERLEFYSPPLAAGFTLSTTDVLTFNVWALENNMNANVGLRARAYRWNRWTNATTEVGGSPFDDGVELPLTIGVLNWTASPTANVTFVEGDRLLVRLFLTNVGTMAGGFTATIDLEGATGGADGDSYFQISNTVTFKSEIPIDVDPALPKQSAIVVVGHPLAPDFGCVMNGGELLGSFYPDIRGRWPGKIDLAGSNIQRAVQKTPGGLRFNASLGSIDFGPVARMLPGSVSQFSIVIQLAFQMTNAPGGENGIVGSSAFNVTGSETLAFIRSNVAGELKWKVGSTADANIAIYNSPTLGTAIWVLTFGSRGSEIWREGIKVASNATVNSRTTDAANNFRVGGINGSPDDIAVGFVYVYKRQLTPAQIRWITRAPV